MRGKICVNISVAFNRKGVGNVSYKKDAKVQET